MAYVAPTAASAGVAYTAEHFNEIKDDVIWLYNQRPLAGKVYGGTDWSPTAADGTFEDDTDAATTKVTLTLVATSTVFVFANIRVTSDTQRDEAVKFRCKVGSSYGTGNMYQGFPAANCRINYPLVDWVASVAAGSVDIILSGAQAEADDAITIEDRTILVLAIPD